MAVQEIKFYYTMSQLHLKEKSEDVPSEGQTN